MFFSSELFAGDEGDGVGGGRFNSMPLLDDDDSAQDVAGQPEYEGTEYENGDLATDVNRMQSMLFVGDSHVQSPLMHGSYRVLPAPRAVRPATPISAPVQAALRHNAGLTAAVPAWATPPNPDCTVTGDRFLDA